VKIITPASDLAYPLARGGSVLSYHMLESGEPYLVNALIAELLLQSSPDSKIEDPPEKPLHKEIQSMMIMFPGGLGDILSMKSCLEYMILGRHLCYPYLNNIGFVSSYEDRELLLDNSTLRDCVAVFDYPIALRRAEQYDAWVSFGAMERQSIEKELQDSFAEVLGIDSPKSPASLTPNPVIKKALRGYIKDTGRIRVGMQIYSAAHYRTWHPANAIMTAIGLTELGCDVYIIGGPSQKLQFTENGVQAGPPENVIDTSGQLKNNEELVGFCSLMDFAITADTALLHIAGCLRLPGLGLFGLTDGAKRTSYYPTISYINGTGCPDAPCWSVAEHPLCAVESREPFCRAMMNFDPHELVDRCEQIMKEASLIA
jgi:Glycosyltransferase family 9 (heptosyltransferase)